MNYLLAYPRSGSSWIRYILEALTGRPSVESDERKSKNLIKRFCKDSPINLDLSKPPIVVKFHSPSESGRSIRNAHNSYLFLSLRDPKEVILSYLYSHGRVKQDPKKWVLSVSKHFESQLNRYVANIKFWLRWDGKKSIIVYEDLIIRYEFWVKRFAQILDVPQESCDLFLENYVYHKNACLKLKSQPGFMKCNTKDLPDEKRIRYWKDLLKKDRIGVLNQRIRSKCNSEVFNLLQRSLQQYL